MLSRQFAGPNLTTPIDPGVCEGNGSGKKDRQLVRKDRSRAVGRFLLFTILGRYVRTSGRNLLLVGTSNQVMPKLTDLKETCLYVDDLPRAKEFYEHVLGLPVLVHDSHFCALDVAARHVLLLFVRRTSAEGTNLPGGIIPSHDGAGPIHIGFAVTAQELPKWESHLKAQGVEILSQVSWPRGGRSIYFRDPDGHLLELLTPGVWSTY